MKFRLIRRLRQGITPSMVPILTYALWLGMTIYLNRFVGVTFLRVPGGPFSAEGFSRFLRETIRLELPPLILMLGIGMGSWGLGLKVLEAAGIKPKRGLDHLMGFALGIGFLACGLFVLGLAQVFYAPVLWIYAVLALGWGLVSLYHRFPDIPKDDLCPAFTNSAWTIVGGSLTLYALWHGFVIALAPILPSDATVYHLCLPKLYLQAHGVYAVPGNIFSHWPHLMDMLFSLPISLGADRGAALIHWLFCAIFAAAVFLVGREEVDERAAWIATILVVTQKAFLGISGAAYIDGAIGLFAFLSMMAIWNGLKNNQSSWVIIAGILGGMAAATKLLGVVTLALSTLWILWRVPRAHKGRAVFLFLLPASLIVGPWLLKTWVTMGNPVWPFLPQIFGDHQGSLHTLEIMNARFQPDRTGLELYLSQFSMAPTSPNWAGDIFRPFFFLTLLAFLFRSRWPPIMTYWFFPILPYLATLGPESDFRRYLAPLWGNLYLWNAWVLGDISRRSKILSVLVMAVVVSLTASVWQQNEQNALLALSQWRPPLKTASNAEDFYYASEAPYVLTLKKMDMLLGPQDKVYLIHEVYAYYLTHPYEFAFVPGIQPSHAFRQIPNADALAQMLRRRGFTHVLIRDYPDLYLRQFSDQHYHDVVSGLATRYGKEILSAEQRHLYKLDFSKSALRALFLARGAGDRQKDPGDNAAARLIHKLACRA